MKFSLNREALLKPLSLAAGVVERRHTLPILSNLLLKIQGKQLTIVGTDAEIEIAAALQVEEGAEGELTLPAKKLLDICKSLRDDSVINASVDNERVVITSGKSRFTLASLPAQDFPVVKPAEQTASFSIAASDLKKLIDKTSFAMAQQDVRYFLNGMLWELESSRLRVVATDGHRLAMCDQVLTGASISEKQQIIVPRKGIQELARLLEDDGKVDVSFDSHHIRIKAGEVVFTSKLIDGKFPDYERVLPKNSDKEVLADRNTLKESLSRVSILSNEKFRGVRLNIQSGELTVSANNPEQEEAEENLAIDYQGDKLEIGFNVGYLIDVCNVIKDDQVRMQLSDSNSSALVGSTEDSDAVYVVMPMRL